MFIRYGKVPEDERSTIWFRGSESKGKEDGVSVYEAHETLDGTYAPVIPYPPNEDALDDYYHYLRYYTGEVYLVDGDVVGKGSDGEPLIRNVKIIKKLK